MRPAGYLTSPYLAQGAIWVWDPWGIQRPQKCSATACGPRSVVAFPWSRPCDAAAALCWPNLYKIWSFRTLLGSGKPLKSIKTNSNAENSLSFQIFLNCCKEKVLRYLPPGTNKSGGNSSSKWRCDLLQQTEFPFFLLLRNSRNQLQSRDYFCTTCQ